MLCGYPFQHFYPQINQSDSYIFLLLFHASWLQEIMSFITVCHIFMIESCMVRLNRTSNC